MADTITLTDAQTQFLQKYLSGKNFLKKKAITSEYKDFLGRQAKARAAIDVLMPDNPVRQQLEARMQAAQTQADAGKFSNAYDALKSVKKDARKAANGFKSGLSAADVRAEIALLDSDMIDLAGERNERARAIEDKFSEALNYLRNRNPVSSKNSKDEAFAYLRDLNVAISQARTQLALRKAELDTNVKEMDTRIGAFGLDAKRDAIQHKIGVIEQMQPGAGDALTAELTRILDKHAKAGFANAGSLISERVLPKHKAASTELDNLAQSLTDLSKFSANPSLFTDNDGKVPSKGDIDKIKKDMDDRFGEFERRDRKRVEDAMLRMETDLQNEKIAMNVDAEKGAITRLETFDAFDMFEKVQPMPKKADEWIKVRVAKEAGDAIRAELAELVKKGAKNDALFDVAAKNPAEWRKEIVEGMGLDLDDPNTDPSISEAVDGMVASIMKEVIKGYPNKASEDMSTFTLGDAVYGNRKFLATGGGGTVSIYEDVKTGAKIVLKEPKGFKPGEEIEDGKFEEFADEARSHWQAIGGEKGPAPTNIMGMEGLVLAANGQPLLAMPLATGGNAEDMSYAVNAAEQTGLISPQAKNAIVQETVRQMAMGIKQMQDAGMSHHDLKEANVFIMADGTVKIADFGLANILDDHDEQVPMTANTAGYEPDEFQETGKLGEKSDNFTLGVILSKMTDPRRGFDTLEQGRNSSQLAMQQSTTTDDKGNTEVIGATALDRLRNALLEHDTDQRAEMTQVLLSTYLYEGEKSYLKENLAELQAASNAYAQSVGKKTGKLEGNIQVTEGKIATLERDLSGDLPSQTIAYGEKVIAKNKVQLLRIQSELQEKTDRLAAVKLELGDLADKPTKTTIDKTTDPTAKKALQDERARIERALASNPVFAKKAKEMTALVESIKFNQSRINSLNRDITKLEKANQEEAKKIGVPKSATEARELREKIANLRATVVTMRSEIEAIHNDPAYKDVVDRLKKANEAFR